MFANICTDTIAKSSFEKVFLKVGESRRVEFTLGPDKLGFYANDGSYRIEPGEFHVFVGGSSQDVQQASFKLVSE